MNRSATLALIFLTLTLLASGCAPLSGPSRPVPNKASLAVAGFSVPNSYWELFSESPLPSLSRIDPAILDTLDKALQRELEARGREPYRGMAFVRQCQEIVLQEHVLKRLRGHAYWTLVGRCIPSDFLLVPHLLEWRERQGDQWAVQQPAKVVFDLYLLNIQKGDVQQRFHFEQEQRSLSDNLLTLSRFLKRQGKWVTAQTLAAEGIAQGLTELGL